jgi:hypothetical protein
MGHYMGDNAQSIYTELAYRPIRGMLIKMSYTHDTKYNSYAYLRNYRNGSEVIRDGGISETISQPAFDHSIFSNDLVRLDGIYEVHPNMYLTLAFEYNNAQGFDNLKTDAIKSEDVGDAQYYLDKYMPLYKQGKNFTVSAAFSFGF